MCYFESGSLSNGKKKPIVKIVAIAKDESSYIADWVFHHLFFGFDKIHVYINRVTDETEEILSIIGDEKEEVTYEKFDWVDWVGNQKVSGKIQQLAYSHALDKARLEKDCDYLFFIDVDEYWVPKDFRSSFSDCLDKLGFPEAVSFEWENFRGDDEPFGLIPSRLSVKGGGPVKTAVAVDSDIKKVRIHAPSLPASSRHVLSDGTSFRYCKKVSSQVLDRSESSRAKDFFILHRLFRSEIEYLAALVKGVPNRDGIKINRPGFLRPDERCEELVLDETYHSEYLAYIYKLREELSLQRLIEESQTSLMAKVDQFVTNLPVLALQDFYEVKKVLRGVKDPRVVGIIKKAEKVVVELEPRIVKSVPELISMAFWYERNKRFYSAYYVMFKAYEIRPNGPVINKALSRYAKKISL